MAIEDVYREQKVRYKCANCGFIFDTSNHDYRMMICPKCASNALDKVAPKE